MKTVKFDKPSAFLLHIMAWACLSYSLFLSLNSRANNASNTTRHEIRTQKLEESPGREAILTSDARADVLDERSLRHLLGFHVLFQRDGVFNLMRTPLS